MNKRLIVMLLFCLPMLAVAEPEADEVQKTDWVDKRVARLTKELNLNAEQQNKVKSIFETQRDKIKAVREEAHNSLQAVLTPEQMKQYDEMREQRKQKMKEHLKERFKNSQQKTTP